MVVGTIIVAGGSGRRMGGSVPKQFIEVCGTPILMRTIKNFSYLSASIVVVLPSDCVDMWGELCVKHSFAEPHAVVVGGLERFDSVAAGLAALRGDCDVILVQDGVRPFASRALIERVIAGAVASGAAIPAIAPSDTIRTKEGSVLDRLQLLAVQTPQGFRAEVLRQAYAAADRSRSFTDDASVVQSTEHDVAIVAGEPENIKITTPFDLKIAKTIW